MTYNILHGHLNIDESILFTRSWNRTTRGHAFKLFKPPAVREVRQHFFSQRVISNWNSLPSSIVEAHTINKFKALFDDYNKNNDCLYVY